MATNGFSSQFSTDLLHLTGPMQEANEAVQFFNWFGCEQLLPGFHVDGESPNVIISEVIPFIQDVSNPCQRGDVIAFSVPAIKRFSLDSEVANDYHYHRHFAVCQPVLPVKPISSASKSNNKSDTTTGRYGICLLCGKEVACKAWQALRTHIQRWHKELVPYTDLSDERKAEISNAFVLVCSSDRIMRPINKTNPFCSPLVSGPVVADVEMALEETSAKKSAAFGKMFKNQGKQVPIDIRNVIVVALCLGNLPLNFIENPGLRYLIMKLNGGELPAGCSARSITRAVMKKYVVMLAIKKTDLNDIIKAYYKKFFGEVMLNAMKAADEENRMRLADEGAPIQLNHLGLVNTVADRTSTLQQDAWTSRASFGFLGVVLSIMVVDEVPWRICTIPLATRPFKAPHTAEQCLVNCTAAVADFGISLEQLTAVTQDTTPSSINTFDSVPHVSQLACFAHLQNLLLKWSVADTPEIAAILKLIHDLVVKLAGSTKRLQVCGL
jgi:hypothetical protein